MFFLNIKGKKMELKQEALFDSAHAALVFAFNISNQCFDRPPLARMALSPLTGSGRGLSGLDGAAQAGMIRSEVKALGELMESSLIARFAPRNQPCSCKSKCCSGKQFNMEWRNAIAWLTNHIKGSALSGTHADYRVARSCVDRYFHNGDQKISTAKLALTMGIHRNSVESYVHRVSKLLKAVESQAYASISDRLQEINIVK